MCNGRLVGHPRPRAGFRSSLLGQRCLTHRLPFPDRDPRRAGRLSPDPPSAALVPDADHRRLFLPVLVLGLVLAALSVAGPAAAAKKSCGDAVVADWYGDGRVDKVFPLRCYQEAICSLPVDVLDYRNAKEDILRALAFALEGERPRRVGWEPADREWDREPERSRRPRHGHDRRAERPEPSGRRRWDRDRCLRGGRHGGAVVGAAPAVDPRWAGAPAPRSRRGRLPQPPRAVPPQRRTARPRLSRRSSV